MFRILAAIAVLAPAAPARAESLALCLNSAFAAQDEAAAPPADRGGEFFVSGYLGNSWILDSDLTVGGMRYDDVEWDTESWTNPLYYGARFGYWFREEANGPGLMIDFTHSKAIASPVSIGAPLTGFELSHGINYLTLNVVYRNFPKGRRDDTFMGRVQPYIGVGGGIAIPHVEGTFGGVTTGEYQVTGPVFQALVGFNFDIVGPMTAFIEYKFNYADISVDLVGGVEADTEIFDHQLIFGVGVRF